MKIIFVDKKDIKKFCDFPKSLYPRNRRTQNSKEEELLLTENHILSHYFHIQGLLVIDSNENVLARCAITIYNNDTEKAYIGFFECKKDLKISKFLFKNVEKYCNSKGVKEIIGPVDASFWYKYRLKIDDFDSLYYGEPYNLEYYYRMFKEAGYTTTHHYNSSNMKKIDSSFQGKMKKYYKERLGEEYHIKSLDMKEFDDIFDKLYYLFIEIYKDFPMYQNITKEEFKYIYNGLKYVINPKTIKLSYYKDELVGFFISLPDFKNLLYGKITLIKLLKVVYLKYYSKRYVYIYMGIKKQFPGLGTAMAEEMVKEVKKLGGESIAALIEQGKVSGNYYKDLIYNKKTYVLLNKKI